MSKLNDLELKTWRTFISAHAAVVERIERELETADRLPLRSYDVLVALWEAESHKLRMHELARQVILSRSGLSRLVDRLEKEGLLSRERTTDDRRGAYAVLTDEGLAAMRHAWPVYAQGIQTHFATLLTPQEMAILHTALSRVEAAARSPRP